MAQDAASIVVSPLHETGMLSASPSRDIDGLVGLTFVDRYRIDGILSSTDLSIVYKGFDQDLDLDVVLRGARTTDVAAQEIFSAEARKLAELQHPNVVRYLGFSEPYCISELLIGRTLASILAKGRSLRTKTHVIRLIEPIAEALAAAHEQGVRHGRLSDSDIILTVENGINFVKVVGFGTADLLDLLRAEDPSYFVPEWFGERPRFYASLKERADIVDLAVLAYRAITLQMPRRRDGTTSKTIVQFDPVASHTPGIDDSTEIDRILRKAIMMDSSSSYSNFNEFLLDLRNWGAIADDADISDSFVGSVKSVEKVKLESTEQLESAGREKLDSTKNRQLKPAHIKESDFASVSEKQKIDKVAPGSDIENGATLIEVGSVVFNRYVLLDVMGSSDIARVFAAKDLEVDRVVAIKSLTNVGPHARVRFRQGIEEIRHLKHESLPGFIDYKEEGGNCYFIMEFCDAPTLDEVLELSERTETEEQIADTGLQLCKAVSFLQSKKVSHGNISASSIMLLEEEGAVKLKLVGFGTGKVRRLSREESRCNSLNMAEEAFSGDEPENDVYSIAAVIYKMVTGRSAGSVKSGWTYESIEPYCHLFGVEKLDELLKNSLQADGKTITEIEEALVEWIELVRSELGVDFESKPKPLPRKTGRRWSKEVRVNSEIGSHAHQDRVGLKRAQLDGEHALTMQFAKVVSRGRRKSPVRATAELIGIVLGVSLIILSASNYIITNFESLKSSYLSASRRLSGGVIAGKGIQTDLQSEPTAVFDYRQDPGYSRWTKGKEFVQTRRIEPSGKLRVK